MSSPPRSIRDGDCKCYARKVKIGYPERLVLQLNDVGRSINANDLEPVVFHLAIWCGESLSDDELHVHPVRLRQGWRVPSDVPCRQL